MTAPYDTRKYECCAPYHGEVGQAFTRRFKPEFEGALHGYVDDYASLFEHVVLQTDPGSAGVPHVGGAAAIQQSQRAYDKRLKKSFGLIRRHVEDEALRDAIDNDAMGNGPAAWAIVVAAGTAQQTYLNLNDQDQEWQLSSFTDVGYDERTLENFKALLDRLNRERPVDQRKSNIQVWQKLLQGIRLSGHAELKLKATDQLQTPTLLHPAGPLAGQPNVGATVQSFAERWRAALADGSIKRQAARKTAAPSGNRVDGLMANTLPMDMDSLSLFLGEAQHRQPTPNNERVCWNCKGLGHMAKDSSGKVICPSPIQVRSYATCINALEIARKRDGLRKSVRFVRRKPASRLDGRLAGSEEMITLEVGEDGVVYTADGVALFSSLPEGTEITELDQSGDHPAAGNTTSTAESSAALQSSVCVTDTNQQPAIHHARLASTPAEATVDEDFMDAFLSPSLLVDCTAESPVQQRWHPRQSNRSVLTLSLLTTLVCGLAITFRKLPPASRMLMFASLGSAMVMPAVSHSRAHRPVPFCIDAKLGALKIHTSTEFNPKTGGAIDTGATKHASGKAKLFPKKYVTAFRPNLVVEMADNNRCAVELVGSMLLPITYRDSISTSAKKRAKLLVSDALLVPELKDVTLISPKALFANEGIRTYFNDDLYMRSPSGHIFDFVETDRLYILPFLPDESVASHVLSLSHKPAKPSSIDHLHAKFAHLSVDSIISSQHCLVGLDVSHLPISARDKFACEVCARAAMRRHAAPEQKGVKFTRFAQCICSDTCDMGVYSIPFGFRYFLTFLDMATRYLFVYFLRTHEHAEVRRAFLQFMADAKQYMPRGRVEIWFMDNGGEFNVAAGVGKDKPGFHANDTDSWLAEYFTRRRFIVPWNPQQNPAESANRVLLRPARACLLESHRHPRFWPFAIHQSVIIYNALITRSKAAVHTLLANIVKLIGAQDDHAVPVSPYMMLHHKPFNARFLEPLFCLCYCRITNRADLALLTKPEPRSTPAIHLGLDPRRHGFFVYLIEYQRYTTAAYFDVMFPSSTTYPDFSVTGGELVQPEARTRLPSEQTIVEGNPVEPHRLPTLPQDDDDRPSHEQRDPRLPSGNTRSARRQTLAGLSAIPCDGYVTVARQPTASGEVLMLLKSDVWRPMTAPATVREAMEQDEQGWLAAYRKDFQAKMANGTFIYVDRPTNGSVVHPIGWAHRIVWNDDNTVAELRARLVGKGYRQVKGVDFEENYSSTPRIASIRLFLSLVAVRDLETEHCDVIKAFTQNAVTDVDNLLVEQPPGLPTVLDENNRPRVLKCVMALEGFRQSGHLHQVNHSATFTNPNAVASFVQVECEPTVFVHRNEGRFIAAVVWTDDVLFAYDKDSSNIYERFLAEVYGKRWNFKRKGTVQRFAGLDISRDRTKGTISISMEKYTEGIFKRFVPLNYPTRSLPTKGKDAYADLSTAKTTVERDAMKDKPYLAACASLLWLHSTLRADISVHVATLCQIMHDPSLLAWGALVDLIAYVHYSKSASITFSSSEAAWLCPEEFDGDRAEFSETYGLHGFCDSSWKLRSLSGHIIFIAGGPVDWATKLIRTVCHSSAEAEVAAGCNLAKSLMYIRQLLSSLGLELKSATPVFIDSKAAILIASNLGVTKRTLHFERWQHYLRLCVARKVLRLIHVVTQRQRADGLTKVVDATSHRWLHKTLFVG